MLMNGIQLLSKYCQQIFTSNICKSGAMKLRYEIELLNVYILTMVSLSKIFLYVYPLLTS